ncbi:pyridoxal phosphate-dependent decarboxylase family protein [Cellulosimicrobium funkei]|uniref:Aspartate aminotransferase family protein n=1 Tax=Cellulosimicrobium funkei TaxID=264251 RepID=A0A4Y8R7E8_9MICO|nr:pyridoxal-dependent decarboxylase [Cellulosimicrobium funkei]TFF16999.1 aspartate aminotransferase family protein [Cellulosimicrobium funkei]TGA70857.1 aspartate aminotransferase family protein [Cellulosimicrobium terreum]
MDDRDAALLRAHEHAAAWLDSLATRPVPPRAGVADVVAALGTDLPDGPSPAADVVDLLATACGPGLTAMPSGRFYGMVIGGSHPAALAADWLTSAWDQNSALRTVTPAHTAVEDVTSAWLLELLGLPASGAVGFVTGATTANFTALAAARGEVLRRAGWDVRRDGLTGAPRVRVLVGAERHESVDLALSYLGLGAPEVVAADDQGRVSVVALEEALADPPSPSDDRGSTSRDLASTSRDRGSAPAPTIVVLQAGNVHSGAFDPFGPAVEVAHRHGAWVHVDGAFGLFAAASPTYRHLVAGYEGADSWATDAHKTLNVPYDCGLAIVADPAPLRAAMGMHGDYLIQSEAGDPLDKVPELSRRGRAFPVWAVLRALGRSGVADLVDGFCRHAATFADAVRALEGEVLHDVVFTQVCAAFGDDARTQDVVRRVLDDGTAWMSGSRWHDRAVLRVSVSSWATTDADVAVSVGALGRAVAATRA